MNKYISNKKWRSYYRNIRKIKHNCRGKECYYCLTNSMIKTLKKLLIKPEYDEE